VGGLDPSTSVHYVTQEVSLTAAQEEARPAALVLEADVERRLLLAEAADLAAKAEASDYDLHYVYYTYIITLHPVNLGP
jgi:ATP-binding cassette subfamily F protein 3